MAQLISENLNLENTHEICCLLLTCNEFFNIGIFPAKDIDKHEGEDDGHEAADPQDELAREIPELRQKGVEEECEDQAQHGHRQADRVDIVIKDGLEVNLKYWKCNIFSS